MSTLAFGSLPDIINMSPGTMGGFSGGGSNSVPEEDLIGLAERIEAVSSAVLSLVNISNGIPWVKTYAPSGAVTNSVGSYFWESRNFPIDMKATPRVSILGFTVAPYETGDNSFAMDVGWNFVTVGGAVTGAMIRVIKNVQGGQDTAATGIPLQMNYLATSPQIPRPWVLERWVEKKNERRGVEQPHLKNTGRGEQ